ncbi:MAG: penicillin-binding protein 2 [Rhodospirillaceae bacterium]|jgi:penicillin-binding protein 2|nr:penicillin-binding protein 2 [Rhodospirillaceae bacterium]
MIRDNNRIKIIGRRALILGSGKLVILSVLIGRIYYLQILETDKYTMLAEANRINLHLLQPIRGKILDRNGTPMAINQQNYRLMILSKQVSNLSNILDNLANIISISDHDRIRIIHENKRQRGNTPIIVHENLSWEDIARIEINTPNIPGVIIDVSQTRNYPIERFGVHPLGYISAASVTDLLDSSDPLLKLPGFRIGKTGIERVYDLALRGKAGIKQVEINANGRIIRELRHDESKPGIDLNLTIDINLQQFVGQRLGNESAAVVVIDVNSGEILVMVSTPSFDPNIIIRGINYEEWNDLISNPRAPLTNKAIAGQYPPGSTFKLITALAALESGIIDKDKMIFCSGQMSLNNNIYHCWKKNGHGSLNLIDGIKNSCDVYFYEISRCIGFEKIAKMAKCFGLGTQTGIDLLEERAGIIPNREWKLSNLGKSWNQGETLISAIGQSYVLTTPLQLAVMTARIANDGYAVRPHLTRDIVDGVNTIPRPVPNWSNLGISKQSLAIVRRGMFAVVNDPGGTAYKSRIKDNEMIMSGKSGSSQVRRITLHERSIGIKKNKDLPWKDRDHALFVAYAPEIQPRFACCITIEHGGSGSTNAAPIARDILIEVQKRYLHQNINSTKTIQRNPNSHDSVMEDFIKKSSNDQNEIENFDIRERE